MPNFARPITNKPAQRFNYQKNTLEQLKKKERKSEIKTKKKISNLFKYIRSTR